MGINRLGDHTEKEKLATIKVLMVLLLVQIFVLSANQEVSCSSRKKLITSAQLEVKDSRISGMFQSYIQGSQSCFGISARYHRVL